MNKIVLILLFFFVVAGCAAKIPPESVALNQNVQKGIEALKQNALQLVDMWEQTAFSTVAEKWSEIYDRADKAYRNKRNVTGAYNEQQAMEVAALAGLMKDKLNDKIRDEAAKMRQTVTTNSDVVLRMNEGVTDLLSSARRVIETNQALLDTVTSVLPVPQGLLEVTPSGGN